MLTGNGHDLLFNEGPPLNFHRVIVRDVQVVNRNRLKSSGHTLDLAHLFERRRAIMDSAIVRLLKKEKEMSLDDIANKVGIT